MKPKFYYIDDCHDKHWIENKSTVLKIEYKYNDDNLTSKICVADIENSYYGTPIDGSVGKWVSYNYDKLQNVYFYKINETNFTKYYAYNHHLCNPNNLIIDFNKCSYDQCDYDSLNIIDFSTYEYYDGDNKCFYTMKYKNDWIIFYANSEQIGKLNLNTLECDFIESNSTNTTKHLREFYSKYPN